MKLYLRRQTLTASKGLINKYTQINFSLYARLDLTPEEQTLVKDFVLDKEVLGSHEALNHGEKEVSLRRDNLRTSYYTVAELTSGKDISCLSFVNMMGLEGSLLSGGQTLAMVLKHAKEVKQNGEAV